MSNFLRASWKQKPQAYGPVEVVQRDIRLNAERVGIDPGSIALYLPMWEKAGTTIYDYSSAKRFTVGSGVTILADSCRFSGGTSIIDVGSTNIPNGNGKRTISFRFKTDNFGTATERAIFSQTDSSSAATGELFIIYVEDGAISVGFDSHRIITPKSKLSTGIYYTVDIVVPSGATKTGDTLIYINGQLQTLALEAGSTRTIDTLNSNVCIGTDEGKNDGFTGNIERFALYRADLKPTQIALLSDYPYILLARNPARTWFIPIVAAETNINSTLGAVIVTGYDTTVLAGTSVEVTTGVVIITGYDASIDDGLIPETHERRISYVKADNRISYAKADNRTAVV